MLLQQAFLIHFSSLSNFYSFFRSPVEVYRVIFIAYISIAFTMLCLYKKSIKAVRLKPLFIKRVEFQYVIMNYGKIIFNMVLWIYTRVERAWHD